jgi:hypothetical protein
MAISELKGEAQLLVVLILREKLLTGRYELKQGAYEMNLIS